MSQQKKLLIHGESDEDQETSLLKEKCGMKFVVGWFHLGRISMMETRAMLAGIQPGQCDYKSMVVDVTEVMELF